MGGKGSGGTRRNAGRPRGSAKLTEMQKLWVGSRCEELWRSAWRVKYEEAKRRWFGSETEKAQEENLADLLRGRKTHISRYEQRVAAGAREDRGRFLGGLSLDIDEKLVPVEVVLKPQGVQSKIKKIVQAEMFYDGISISIGTIEKCWKAFRSLEAVISSHERIPRHPIIWAEIMGSLHKTDFRRTQT
jgi:hypothetical protein